MSMTFKICKVQKTVLILAMLVITFASIGAKANFDLTKSASDIIGTEDIANAIPDEALDMIGDNDILDADMGGGIKNILLSALKKIVPSVRNSIKNGIGLFAIAFLCGIASPFIKQGADGGISAVGVCGVAAVLAVGIAQSKGAVTLCLQAIGNVGSFSSILLPSLAAASVISGHTMTGSALSATALIVTTTFIQLIKGIFIPLIYIYIAMTSVNAVLNNQLMEGITKLIKGFITGSLKLGIILYTSYLGISGAIAAAVDGSYLKTAKFAISGAIPVVGSTVSDAAESVMSGAVVIKNSVGVFGMLVILAICIVPFLKIAMYYIVYKICTALCSIVTIKPVTQTIDGMGDGFGMAMGVLGTSSILFFISVVLSILLVNPL